MNDPRLHPSAAPGSFPRKPLLVAGAIASAVCIVVAVASGDGGRGRAEASSPTAAPVTLTAAVEAAAPAGAAATPAEVAAAAAVTDSTDVPDLDGADLTAADGCLIDVLSVRMGDVNDSVGCLQQALAAQGFYTGPVTGSFDQATFAAVERLQTDRDLFVDGVVGRETAISLGIWPDEESWVVHTPKPPAGAVDLMGYPLSSVASAGADAPPLPEGSGSGRRIVYDRKGQRVWAVDKDGRIIRSWLVSGSKYSNELPGTHQVYSRSEMSTAWNGKAYLPKMVRWLKTDIGAIGFHSIPLHREDNSPYQTEAELGQRLSGGCQRQAPRDADFLWDFAQVGTPVVVI